MIMPMPFYRSFVSIASFNMTAESVSGGLAIGWSDATDGYVNTITGLGAFGSVTAGTFSAGGGTVTDVSFVSADNFVIIKSGNQSAININIDSTDYALTFNSTDSGYDLYTFGPSTSLFADGVTYSIEVT